MIFFFYSLVIDLTYGPWEDKIFHPWASFWGIFNPGDEEISIPENQPIRKSYICVCRKLSKSSKICPVWNYLLMRCKVESVKIVIYGLSSWNIGFWALSLTNVSNMPWYGLLLRYGKPVLSLKSVQTNSNSTLKKAIVNLKLPKAKS